ncbi:MAG: penicillin acylase family protein [Saprospiraceae bacterium]|nr:penicillin acylase family protein [Saprospiraceae bacterium]
MKRFVGILPFVITLFLIYILNNPQQMGSTSLPKLGYFLSPYTGFMQNGESRPDFTFPSELTEQFKAPVHVYFDDRLVPHIYAENDEDAFRAQGYIQAHLRMWQMDMTTRAAGGQLAEVMGARLIDRDKNQRRLGLLYAAEKTEETWKQDPAQYALLQAFADGVNGYIATLNERTVPLEYKLVGHWPKSWSVLQCALYVKTMAQRLNAREDDLQATNTIHWLGVRQFAEIFPEINPLDKPVIPSEVTWDFTPIQPNPMTLPDSILGGLPSPVHPASPGFDGSNNWAVSGAKSTTSAPILCNDPHLGLTLPSIWFEISLHTPTINAHGVALPGTPGIVIGFNQKTAWGVTNVGQDVADWYRIRWTDATKTHYLMDGDTLAVFYRREEIAVKSGEPIVDSVKWTKIGPIVYEDAGNAHVDLAYRWISLDSDGNELKTFMQLDRSGNYQDYREALKSFCAPAQNFVFATNQGDIGLTVNGHFPVKSPEVGRFVFPAEEAQYRWNNTIPFEQLPTVHNPDQGYVASANQRSTDETYPYYYNGSFEDYRGRTINNYLDSPEKFSVDDMKRFQLSSYSQFAADALPILLSPMDESMEGSKELETLQMWDYHFEADAVAPIYFTLWWRHLYQLVWDEFTAKSKEEPIIFPENFLTIQWLKERPDDPFMDVKSTKEIETAPDLIRKSWLETVAELDSLDAKNWGEFAPLNINHLANIPAFSRQHIAANGHATALNATNGPASHGPSWRMIVQLGSTPNAIGVYPGGQDGNPASAYYDQMVDSWVSGNYYPLLLVDQDYWQSHPALFTITTEK